MNATRTAAAWSDVNRSIKASHDMANRPPRFFNVRYTKTGGLHFLRIGSLVFSFCVTRKAF
jgi:hypothetical protein